LVVVVAQADLAGVAIKTPDWDPVVEGRAQRSLEMTTRLEGPVPLVVKDLSVETPIGAQLGLSMETSSCSHFWEDLEAVGLGLLGAAQVVVAAAAQFSLLPPVLSK